jgi:hypothetical protein
MGHPCQQQGGSVPHEQHDQDENNGPRDDERQRPGIAGCYPHRLPSLDDSPFFQGFIGRRFMSACYRQSRTSTSHSGPRESEALGLPHLDEHHRIEGRLGERRPNGLWNLDIPTGNAILRPKPRTDMATLRRPPHVLALATGVGIPLVGGPTGATSWPGRPDSRRCRNRAGKRASKEVRGAKAPSLASRCPAPLRDPGRLRWWQRGRPDR